MTRIQEENLSNKKMQEKILCFLQSMERACKGCYHKACNNCDNAYAKDLLQEINFDKKIIINGEGSRIYASNQRKIDIKKALGNGWKSISEIDLNLSPRGKRNAILKAFKSGLIERKESKHGYLYKIKDKNNE